ncbi:hypothetical protein [Kutzneria sp. CA-103260]|uniref:hypothetical protein n=1 Tax=Kutzneria sp. CA-103260 TaxID=2802641 RepID=UPI001BA6AA85|nr:hypothetical protein [Kutzneria sp. CA-103260]QUQ70013.1 hypothetical protein JJ691_77840 [Kutzneria sp. CA-103260]
MNGDSPHGQPWSVDLLADLHADGGDRSRLDADALAVLAALDATQAELADLPPMRMPDNVAARLDAVIAAEAAARAAVPPQQRPVPTVGTPAAGRPTVSPPPVIPAAPPPPSAPVVDLAEARRRRNRRLGIAGGLLAAAAVAVGVVFVTLPSNTTGGMPQAVPGSTSIQTDPPNGGVLALKRGDLPGAGFKAYGSTNYGPYADTAKLKACLAANNLSGKPMAGRLVTVDGQPGVMMLLPGGALGKVRLLVVGDNCAAGNPDTIINTTIGG